MKDIDIINYLVIYLIDNGVNCKHATNLSKDVFAWIGIILNKYWRGEHNGIQNCLLRD